MSVYEFTSIGKQGHKSTETLLPYYVSSIIHVIAITDFYFNPKNFGSGW